MAGSFVIDVARRCVFSRGWGVINNEDMLEHVTQLRLHPKFEPTFNQVINYQGVTKVELDGAIIRGIATLNPFHPPARRAIVQNRPVVIGLARMYQLSADLPASALRIFDSLEPAFEWLGLDVAAGWPDTPPDWQRGASA